MSGKSAAPRTTVGIAVGSRVVATDRRVARGEHTRTALADAMIDLIDAGNPQPTTHELADRAEVSVRTLFNHFHVDTLLGHAAAIQISRHRMLVALLPPHGPVDARIRASCHQRRQLFDAIAPVLHVVDARVEIVPGLTEVLSDLHSLLQQQVAVTFGPEITSNGPDGPVLLAHLDLVTGWQAWKSLRHQRDRSASAAERAMALFVTRLLA